jgi:hypothetical protein
VRPFFLTRIGQTLARCARRLPAVFQTVRVPVLPLQSFPSPGSPPRSRGSLLPCGFALRPSSGAASLGASRSLSSPRLAREPGRRFLAVASPVASTHLTVRRTFRPLPLNTGLAAFERHARFEALLPPGVRSVRPSSWQTKASRPVLSWGCRPPELSINDPGSGLSRRRARGARDPCHARLQAPSLRGCRPRTEHRPGVHEPWVRRRAPSQNRVRATVELSPVPPLGGTPRLPALHVTLPRQGARDAGPRRRWFGIVSADSFFRSRRDPPFDRGGSVVGPPVTRGAGSPGFSSLVDRAPLRTKSPAQRAPVSVTRARLTAPRSTRGNF